MKKTAFFTLIALCKISFALAQNTNPCQEVLVLTDTVYIRSETHFICSKIDTVYIKADTVYEKVDTVYVYCDSVTGRPPRDTLISLELSACELPFIFHKDSGRAAVAHTLGLSQSGLGTDYAAPTRLRFDKSETYLLLHFKDRADKLNFKIKWNSSGEAVWGAFVVEGSSDNKEYKLLRDYASEGGNAFTSGALRHEEIENIPTDIRYIRWRYSQRIDGNIGLGNIELTPYENASEEPIIGILQKSSLKIYPNPSRGLFNLESLDAVEVEIYSLSGQKTGNFSFSSGHHFLDLRHYPKGIYFLRWKTKKGVEIRKIALS